MSAADPLHNVLSRLKKVKRSGDGYGALCPAHDDRNASLSISTGDDGRVLLQCHTGCPPEAVCAAINLKMSDLFPRRSKMQSNGRIVATYDYHDANGVLLYQVVRFDPKDFRQRCPDGHGGWNWKLGRVPRVLYRLPELTVAQADAWTFVAEGEKDVDNLVMCGAIATTNPQGAGKWSKLSDDSALDGRRVVIIEDADAVGAAHAQDVAKRLSGRVRDLRVLRMPGDGKDASDWLAAGGTLEQLIALVEATPAYAPSDSETPRKNHAVRADHRAGILIDTDEHRVICESIEALRAADDIYHRGGMLVRILRENHVQDGIKRCDGSATIAPLPAACLREQMTKHIQFRKLTRREDVFEESAAHPPPWLIAAVDSRADWPGLRSLTGVSDAPTLRADGSIAQTPGYDQRTGVVYEPAHGLDIQPIHEDVGLEEAQDARDLLLDVVCDFPFEAEEHKSAWLAGLLTPLARFAFVGPTPLFLIDANVRAAGKGLLAQTIAHIVLGREMPVSSYSQDSDELRKKITSIAIAGDRMILFDNLEGNFGNDTLDRALTGTRWADRVLGKNQIIDLPLMPAWYATGNNVQVAADTARRVIHVRLDCMEEQPEDRTGFKHENLLSWIDSNRGPLLRAGLTVLSAYLKRGRPTRDLKPFGSFEGWSDVVRNAVLWVGMPDPCLTRTKLVESADTTSDSLQQLIAAWREFDDGNGVVVADMLQKLYPARRDFAPSDAASVGMRAALENLVGCPPGKPPTTRQVANRLRGIRRRVLGDVFLDYSPQEYHRNGAVWRLHRAQRGV